MQYTSVLEQQKILKNIQHHMHLFMTVVLSSWDKTLCGALIDNIINAPIFFMNENDR